MNVGGWVVGTTTSCLTSIIALIGFISTILLTWKKEAREAEKTKLDYQLAKLEVEKLRIELEKQRSKKRQK